MRIMWMVAVSAVEICFVLFMILVVLLVLNEQSVRYLVKNGVFSNMIRTLFVMIFMYGATLALAITFSRFDVFAFKLIWLSIDGIFTAIYFVNYLRFTYLMIMKIIKSKMVNKRDDEK